jgi:hypothetical protein
MRLRVFENSSSTHQTTITEPPHHTQQKNTTTTNTQILHPIPQHQLTPHPNPHIRHTPTTHITPIRPLHTPKHLLNPITLLTGAFLCFMVSWGGLFLNLPIFEYPLSHLRVFENAVFAPSCRFPPLREGNRAEVRFPLPAGFPYCVRGTRKARFPLPAGGT